MGSTQSRPGIQGFVKAGLTRRIGMYFNVTKDSKRSISGAVRLCD